MYTDEDEVRDWEVVRMAVRRIDGGEMTWYL